jgi:hypothetical protein
VVWIKARIVTYHNWPLITFCGYMETDGNTETRSLAMHGSSPSRVSKDLPIRSHECHMRYFELIDLIDKARRPIEYTYSAASMGPESSKTSSYSSIRLS